jgi:DHA1 family multidrug resistance protein-like MFS transporter
MAGGFAIVMGLMGPVWGQVADRYGRRLMILRALFGACVVIGAMALVQSPEQLLVLRLLQGSVTGVVAATTTVVSLTVPRHRLASALGLMHAALFAGTALGPIIGGLVSDQFGFRAAFAVTGGFFFLSGLLVLLFVAEPARETGEQQRAPVTMGQSIRVVLGRRELVAVIGLLTLVRFANVAPQPVLPFFVQQLAGDEARLATVTGMVVAASGIASTVSALLVGHLADRFGRQRTLLVCLVAATGLCALHAAAGSVWQLLLVRTALGLALGGVTPAAQALFTDLTPADRRGMAFGLLATAGAIGNGGGPVVGSLLAAGFGMPGLFLGIAPLFLLGAWLLTRLPGRAMRDEG